MSIATANGLLRVEVGFGVDAVGGDFFVLDDPVKGELDNDTYLLAPDTVYVDVTEHVAAITIDRGRDRELDEYATGTATVVFNDDDRTLDPSYSESPYFGEIVPMKRIEIRWNTVHLFSGWVDDWSVDYEAGDRLSRVTADCVDGFAILANQELDEIVAAHTGDLSGERIERVLSRAEVDYPVSRAIDDGNTVLGDTTLGENALSYLQACARAEAGYLFVAADGTLTFLERTAALNATGDVTFSDNRTNGIPYRSVTQRSAADLLYTRVTAESETTGNVVTADNAAAQDEFLIRTLSLGRLLSIDDDETQNLADYYLERFSSPELRFHTARINALTLSSEQLRATLMLDLTAVANVERSPLGVGSAVERLSLIDHISHRIGHGGWEIELAFSNADTRSFLTLDDAVFGALDANRLAF
jgi:hypothetical protein